MNRRDAKTIAETITNQQLQDMFDRAKNEITNWSQRSIVNKGLSKGIAWNILAKDFDLNTEYRTFSKHNMIREFGDFLPDELKPPKKKKKDLPPPTHQNPIF